MPNFSIRPARESAAHLINKELQGLCLYHNTYYRAGICGQEVSFLEYQVLVAAPVNSHLWYFKNNSPGLLQTTRQKQLRSTDWCLGSEKRLNTQQVKDKFTGVIWHFGIYPETPPLFFCFICKHFLKTFLKGNVWYILSGYIF